MSDESEVVTPDEPHDDQPLGERSGMNQNPLGPSFRDGAPSQPSSIRSLVLGLVPAVVIVAAVLVFVLR